MEIDYTKLQYAMIEKCFTCNGLAKAAGISEVTVNRLMYHNAKPNFSTLGKILKALEISPEVILKG